MILQKLKKYRKAPRNLKGFVRHLLFFSVCSLFACKTLFLYTFLMSQKLQHKTIELHLHTIDIDLLFTERHSCHQMTPTKFSVMWSDVRFYVQYTNHVTWRGNSSQQMKLDRENWDKMLIFYLRIISSHLGALVMSPILCYLLVILIFAILFRLR